VNIFVLEKYDDEGSLCTFYTVRWDEPDAISETDQFFEKFENHPVHKKALQELAVFIFRKIANETGALEEFFRFENYAQALPPGGRHLVGEITIDYGNFPLRLYCLRITSQLVVLFNGGEKSSQTAQSGNTSMFFIEANQFAKRILEAINQNEIYITQNNRELLYYNGNSEIIL
jgi:hypothetical protein